MKEMTVNDQAGIKHKVPIDEEMVLKSPISPFGFTFFFTDTSTAITIFVDRNFKIRGQYESPIVHAVDKSDEEKMEEHKNFFRSSFLTSLIQHDQELQDFEHEWEMKNKNKAIF